MNSYWNIENNTNFDELKEDIDTDICIIGGGLTGLTTAYYLSKQNKDVVILERDKVCSHTSGGNTGKVTSQHGLFYKYLSDSKGETFAKKYLEANESAIKNIENIIKEENIQCDFEKQSAYVFTKQEKELEKIKNEVDTVNKISDISQFVEKVQLPINALGAIEFKNQAKYHPVKYADGLCKAIVKNNGRIFEHSKAIDLKSENGKNVVYLDNYKITANYVVIATRYPIINFPGYHFLKMYQSTSYSIIVDTNSDVPEGMYISSETPTVSFRSIKNGDKKLLQIVGYDYKTGTEILEDGYKKLEDIAKSMYPNSQVKYKWIAEDCISLDKIPYIGEFSNLLNNVYVATGYNKWGITSSNIAATIIFDKILGRKNIYEDVFKSTRMEPVKNREEVKNIVKEATNSILLKKFQVPEEELKDVQKEHGEIIEYNGSKVGIYKDKNGVIHQVKPICTHLGCELSFNNVDKTWDCPCHGSRFMYEGESIEAPSIKNLEKYKQI